MMNKTHFNIKKLQAIFISVFLFAAISCTDSKKTKDSKDVAETQNDAKFENTSTEKDAQFVVNATEIYMNEIKLGQLAQQKSTMADIKALGNTIEMDHTKGLAELKDLAMQKKITIPSSLTENGMDAHKKLNDMSAKDFDKAYCDMMVNGHKDAMGVFKKASEECSDAEIKAWATGKLSGLQMHHDKSMACQTKLDKR